MPAINGRSDSIDARCLIEDAATSLLGQRLGAPDVTRAVPPAPAPGPARGSGPMAAKKEEEGEEEEDDLEFFDDDEEVENDDEEFEDEDFFDDDDELDDEEDEEELEGLDPEV